MSDFSDFSCDLRRFDENGRNGMYINNPKVMSIPNMMIFLLLEEVQICKGGWSSKLKSSSSLRLVFR